MIEINEFSELEYKYKADEIGLKQFTDLMKELGFNKQLTVSSWDYYYTNDSEDFIRLRESQKSPELTIKRKTKSSNNWIRKEVDLPLSASRYSHKAVEEFVSLEGYEENFKIYKSCFIYFQDIVNYVYYIVYDEQMREKGRFIEVEVNKDKINDIKFYTEIGEKEKTPMKYLKEAENKLNLLGISSRNRLKKSLFELFRRPT